MAEPNNGGNMREGFYFIYCIIVCFSPVLFLLLVNV